NTEHPLESRSACIPHGRAGPIAGTAGQRRRVARAGGSPQGLDLARIAYIRRSARGGRPTPGSTRWLRIRMVCSTAKSQKSRSEAGLVRAKPLVSLIASTLHAIHAQVFPKKA